MTSKRSTISCRYLTLLRRIIQQKVLSYKQKYVWSPCPRFIFLTYSYICRMSIYFRALPIDKILRTPMVSVATSGVWRATVRKRCTNGTVLRVPVVRRARSNVVSVACRQRSLARRWRHNCRRLRCAYRRYGGQRVHLASRTIGI